MDELTTKEKFVIYSFLNKIEETIDKDEYRLFEKKINAIGKEIEEEISSPFRVQRIRQLFLILNKYVCNVSEPSEIDCDYIYKLGSLLCEELSKIVIPEDYKEAGREKSLYISALDLSGKEALREMQNLSKKALSSLDKNDYVDCIDISTIIMAMDIY